MKTKLLISLILFLTIASFIIEKKLSVNAVNNSGEPPAATPDSEFFIGVYHSGIDIDYAYYPELKVNAWHKYTGPNWGWPQVDSDHYLANPLDYGSSLVTKITHNRDHGLRSVMDRPKIQYLANGQRSDYQCEVISTGADYGFYAYDTHNAGSDLNDYQFNGNGARVRYCETNPSSPGINAGYVVKDLRANREQANKSTTRDWRTDETYEWYVMPRIRIDTNVLNVAPNTKVCSIIILDWDGDKIDSVDILATNFLDENLNYDGQYIEEYNFSPSSNKLVIDTAEICPGDPKKFYDWSSTDSTNTIKTDFRVYWYGLCDMWIDYVRVENRPAHQLFKGEWNDHLTAEVNFALTGYDAGNPKPNNFYSDEFEFNNIPCIEYVNKLILDSSENKLSLMVALNYDYFRVHVPASYGKEFSADEIDRFLVTKADLKYLIPFSYPLEGWEGNETDVRFYTVTPPPKTYHPNTLYSGNYDKSLGILSYAASVTNYEDSLQKRIDYGPGAAGAFIKIMRKADSISKEVPDLRLINAGQAHLWWSEGHKLKEPSNEELNLLVNLALCYGAKGIFHFCYNSQNSLLNAEQYSRGLAEIDQTPRDSTVYGQNKWDAIKQIDSALKKWGSYLRSFDNENRKSYIYRLADERNEMSSTTFIDKLKAYPALEFAPDPDPDLSNETPETNTDAYLQAAFFQKENETTDKSKYFMIVNRRCSPFLGYGSADSIGGRRLVTMKINPDYLPVFNNWEIFDLKTGDTVRTVSKSDTNYFFLGDFQPGEGKLYKIAPVMQEGGTLVADESFGNVNINCKDTVISNGKNITIFGTSTTINFADSAAIILENADFNCGQFDLDQQAITLKGLGSDKWRGIGLKNSNVKIYNSKFQDIASPVSNFALKLLNCPLGDIRNNTFISSADAAGGINSSYIGVDSDFNLYINYNTFSMNNSRANAIQVQGFSYIILPVYIQHNQMTSNGYATGIMTSSITGGAIKYNNVSGFSTGMNLMFTSTDLYRNTITNTSNQSTGLLATSYSVINLSTMAEYITAGTNNFVNTSSYSKNIYVAGAIFYLSNGVNNFDVHSTSPIQNYHLNGYFPSGTGSTYAQGNCFKLDGNEIASPTLPNSSVGNGQFGNLINFSFNPYQCIPTEPDGEEIADIGNGLYDTIPTLSGGGEGGGKSNYELRIKNYELKETKDKKDQNSFTEITTSSKDIYDSICIQMSFGNYTSVKNLCYELINTFPDSLESLSSLSNLYLSVIKTDTSSEAISNLKTFYESLILNHSNDTALVLSSNYLVQKCKVRLGQYQSALDGFQQIINNNQYSYEGLLASWDYSATSLLLNGQGSSGGISNDKLQMTNDETNNELELSNSYLLNDDPKDKYDKKAFTKEERKIIRQNVFQTFETSKDKEVKKIKELETKISQGTATVNEKSELQMKKVLSEIVKVKEPKDISEHLSIVNNDIQKVFGATGDNSTKEIKNIIPAEYNLSQNYPNPFNPSTKITFDLPNDSKVKLTVYDLLGKEINLIVNGQLLLGRHEYEFDGSNFASGVYFYRLESNNFVQTKRMVLVK